MEYICFLLPAILATGIYEKMFEEELKIKDFIYSVVIYAISINFICFLVLSKILNRGNDPVNSMFIGSFVSKYLFLAVFLAVVLPPIFKYIKETFKVKISIIEVNGKNKNVKETSNKKRR